MFIVFKLNHRSTTHIFFYKKLSSETSTQFLSVLSTQFLSGFLSGRDLRNFYTKTRTFSENHTSVSYAFRIWVLGFLKEMCHRLNLNKTTTNGLVRVWDISSSLENIMSFTNSPKISDLHMYSLPLLKFKFWLMRLCDKASKKAIWSCDWM